MEKLSGKFNQMLAPEATQNCLWLNLCTFTIIP